MRVTVEFDSEGHYTASQGGQPFAPGPGPLPAPPILFLGSLGACAGAFAVSYLKTRELPFEELSVIVEAEFAEDPHRIGRIDVRVMPPSALEERHVKAMGRAVELCTLKQTFAVPPVITTTIDAARVLEPAGVSTRTAGG